MHLNTQKSKIDSLYARQREILEARKKSFTKIKKFRNRFFKRNNNGIKVKIIEDKEIPLICFSCNNYITFDQSCFRKQALPTKKGICRSYLDREHKTEKNYKFYFRIIEEMSPNVKEKGTITGRYTSSFGNVSKVWKSN